MATYIIGDIHGCMSTVEALLRRVDYNPSRDRLWLVGDLVNNGERSADVVRWAREHVEHVTLGNHDLHMIAVAEGVRKRRKKDTFGDVLDAPDADDLLRWMRHRPILVREGYTVMVHAGLAPQWTLDEAESCARELEEALRSPDYHAFFEHMYGDEPDRWHDELEGWARLRVIVNMTTRQRVCTSEGVLEYRFKGELPDVPEGLMPWFRAPHRRAEGLGAGEAYRVFFGHWSAIGYLREDDSAGSIFALDSGCTWGRQLTAFCLEDETITQVDAQG